MNVTTIKQKIEFLRWDFGITIDEIAELLRVKRATIYRYIEGKSLRPKNWKRLEIIYGIGLAWKEEFNIGRIDFLHKKYRYNKSLFDLLNEDKFDLKLIAEFATAIGSALTLVRGSPIKNKSAFYSANDLNGLKESMDIAMRKVKVEL